MITSNVLFAQVFCDMPNSSNCNGATSLMILNNQQYFQDIDFTFEKVSQYTSGINIYGATELKLDIRKNDTILGNCVWGLKMFVSNGGAPTPVDQWQPLSYYGLSGDEPLLSLIEVRVSNSCQTPNSNNVWMSFAANDGDFITLIDDVTGANPAGPLFGCGAGQTNMEGNYLQNPGEFRFRVDYRIKPMYEIKPGKYQLNIKFCLVEL